jgi:hypothetical protein
MEVVEVFQNSNDESADDHFLVHVCGIEKSQSIQDFFWDGGPLMAPGDADDQARPRRYLA